MEVMEGEGWGIETRDTRKEEEGREWKGKGRKRG